MYIYSKSSNSNDIGNKGNEYEYTFFDELYFTFFFKLKGEGIWENKKMWLAMQIINVVFHHAKNIRFYEKKVWDSQQKSRKQKENRYLVTEMKEEMLQERRTNSMQKGTMVMW